MADIFDLARSINARKQQASQGYGSPLEDLPLQVMEIMDTRAKEKRVSLKNDSILLSNLIKGATTEEEIANARQLANKYAKDSYKHDSTKLYGEAINQQFNSKQAAYNQFKSSAEWFDNKLQSTGDSDKELDPNAKGWVEGMTIAESRVASDEASAYAKEHGLDDIQNREFFEKKYLDDLNKGGASYFKMTSAEMQELSMDEIEERRKELESISSGFDAGQELGFKYNKGKSSYVTLQNEYADYRQRLDDTYKAHVTGDKITGEEAMAIMLGDYEGTKKIALKQTAQKLRQLNSQYIRLSKLNIDNMDSDDNDILLQGAEDGKISENSTKTELETYINEEADKVYRQILAQEKRQFLWSGISSEGGSEELGNILTRGGTTTGGVTGGGATTPSNQIISIEGQDNQNKPTNTPPKSSITDISPSKTNIDEKRYSTKDLNKLPELKKANGKFVTTDKDNSLVEWDNVAYIPSLKKNVPILKGKTDMDTYYWDNGWKHLRGQSPSSVMMSEEEYKKEINESKELSKMQKEQFLKDTSRGWKWIKRKLLKSGSIPSGGKIISMNGKEV